MRAGLRALLSILGRVDVSEAEDGEAAVRAASELSPHVVVMDLGMQGMDGIEATRQILARNPAAKVLVLSSYSDVPTVRRAFAAGASGYVLKPTAFDDLPAAIEMVMQGGRYLSAKLRKEDI